MHLCREFGPEYVGLCTGDATVNRDAPILCCTAEILANIALREGADADIDHVVMDEFHYYADRDRGVAWQTPLLTMPQARFLLMSATLGDTDPLRARADRAQRPADRHGQVRDAARAARVRVRGDSAADTIEKLVDERKTPAYVVHFTQADAAASAQDFISLKIATREQKAEIADAHREPSTFNSPYGGAVRKWLRHGIGLHHAGLLPKYRLLVEQLAQHGLLKVICGTDTLGVGINVPIRTVVFTQALQVRRPEDRAPHGARLPPDRRPRRPQGLRRPRLRRRAGARARHREPAPRARRPRATARRWSSASRPSTTTCTGT